MTLRVLLETVIIIFLSIGFFASGMSKITGEHPDLETFQKLGLGLHFVHFIGAAEVLTAIGLFIGKYKMWSATGLAVLAFSEMVAYVLLSDLVEMGLPLVFGFLSALLVYLLATAPADDEAEAS